MNDIHVSKAYAILKDRVLFLMLIHVPRESRGLGVATRLLRRILQVGYQLGCRRAELDDMSDRFMRPENLYRRNGFRYVRKGQPAMCRALGRNVLDL